jgi:peptide/nickel transport system substrate-binding protein
MNRLYSALALSTALSMGASIAVAQVENPLADERVRQAIAYAIDMETIVDTLFEGMAIPADSMIPNGPWHADGLDDYAYNPIAPVNCWRKPAGTGTMSSTLSTTTAISLPSTS